MFNSKPTPTSNTLIDQVAQSADSAIHTTQRVANEAMDGLSHSLQAARQQVVPALNGIGDQATALVHHGMDSVRNTSHQIREGAHHASDRTVAYIREEPVKSMLIAAATGAVLMALARVISQSNHSH